MIFRQYDIQSLRITKSFNDMRNLAFKHKGAMITSMLYFYDAYIYVLTLGTGWENFSSTTTWNPQNLKNLGRDNTFITGIINHGKRWKVQKASNIGVKAQNVVMFDNWPDLKAHIRKAWSKGFDVTDMITSDQQHCVVCSYGLNLKQSWLKDTGYPVSEIEAAAEQGKFITDLIKMDNGYLWIFSGNTGYSRQRLLYGPSVDETLAFQDRLLSDEGFDGYALTGVKEHDGHLLYIFLR